MSLASFDMMQDRHYTHQHGSACEIGGVYYYHCDKCGWSCDPHLGGKSKSPTCVSCLPRPGSQEYFAVRVGANLDAQEAEKMRYNIAGIDEYLSRQGTDAPTPHERKQCADSKRKYRARLLEAERKCPSPPCGKARSPIPVTETQALATLDMEGGTAELLLKFTPSVGTVQELRSLRDKNAQLTQDKQALTEQNKALQASLDELKHKVAALKRVLN